MKIAALILPIIILSGCDFLNPDCPITIGSIKEKCNPRLNQNLDSLGGKIDAALYIAKRTFDTHVETKCLSACVMVVSAGENRSVCSDAIFGVHQATKSLGTKRMKEFFSSDSRIDSSMINHYISITPNAEMKTFSAYEAKSLGLIDEILNCN